MNSIRVALISSLGATLTAGCATGAPPASVSSTPPNIGRALQEVDASDFLKHIETLASDDFEGRSVGARGEAVTVDYLVGEFKRIGLMPGNPDGSYIQRVPLTEHTSAPSAIIKAGATRLDLKFPDDFVAWSFRREPQVNVSGSELVFVGYGVVAPEYAWDDYKGVDLKGKTLLMLINDPQIPDPHDPTKLDDKMFMGKAMTYYGRWTYKYEMAAAVGAAGALIVHETGMAGYPYSVVVNSWARENFDIQTNAPNPHFPAVSGWIRLESAKDVFSATGYDFARLKQAALSRDFRPVALGATIDLSVNTAWRDVASQNVIGRIEGSDPKHKDEHVIYSAHWDHFGWDRELPGSKHDQIYHGAVDNASGVAALLEIAKAFTALAQPPRRSILFIATTAEERGLLGAQFYAGHPLYPLRKTLADINMDGMNLWGRTRDVEVIGSGKSELEDALATAAASQGRVTRPDAHSEKGFFYRADHFEFAKVGVPSLFVFGGADYIGQPGDFGEKKFNDYVAHDYHKVTDVVRPDWNLSGAVENMRLLFQVGYDVAQGARYPEWKAGAEFKARRDEMMGRPH
ncbi:MAG: M20/M25/M40 family metallo-hydrolase [Betaproteobacteria bacterium]|nr:MAG: M20/M25/M40 family metallo-hydrolase [Betaproteobacteria bacterium]